MSIGLPSLWLSAGSKILEVAGSAVHCPDDIPRIPSTSKPTWVRAADYNNPFTTLSTASQRLQALAAADACAEEEVVGIGGWAVTSSQMVWFAETWTQDVRRVWPCLVKPAQRYIACFETLAQLALLQSTHSHIGGGRYSFSMPFGH